MSDDDLAALAFFVVAGFLLAGYLQRARFNRAGQGGVFFPPRAPASQGGTSTPIESVAPGPISEGAQDVLPLTTSPNGVAFLKGQEGFAPRVKNDAGHPEIGWGHDIVPNDPSLASAGVSQAAVMGGAAIVQNQGDAILAFDLAHVEGVVNGAVSVPLSQNQFDALVDFTYNEGDTHFLQSTLLRILNTGDYAGASAQFSRWIYSRGQALAALKKRRAAENQLFNTPDQSQGVA